jgi:hypothetical protein
MFISGSLALVSPLLYSALASAARHAWRCLCFQIPELMVSAICEKDGTYMHYQAPKNDRQAHQWVERTVFFEHGNQRLDFKELRENILQRRGQNGGDSEQAILLIYSRVQDGNDSTEMFDCIINIDHQITDGIGARILLGQYLSILSNSLNGLPGADQIEIDWQESGRNLSPPWISIMNKEQVKSGPDYEEMVEWSRDILVEKMVIPTPSFLLFPSLSPILTISRISQVT